MIDITKEYLQNKYKINSNTIGLYDIAIKDVEKEFKVLDEIREFNQLKVLAALQDERISDTHFTNQ